VKKVKRKLDGEHKNMLKQAKTGKKKLSGGRNNTPPDEGIK